MTSFLIKTINREETLGERLKRLRESHNLTLMDLERLTQVPNRYLSYLENGNYNQLPGEVYIKNFLKAYGCVLNVSYSLILDLYLKERGKREAVTKPHFLDRHWSHLSFIPRFFRFRSSIIIILVFILSLSYLLYELNTLFEPPSLLIQSPLDNFMSDQNITKVVGTTVREARVMINGKEVVSDEKGNFKEEVYLKEGLNMIQVSAIKKYSRPQSKMIRVLVKNQK